jgi:hypothetical protein
VASAGASEASFSLYGINKLLIYMEFKNKGKHNDQLQDRADRAQGWPGGGHRAALIRFSFHSCQRLMGKRWSHS